MQRDGRQHHDQRGRARQQPAGDAEREQAAPRHAITISARRKMRVTASAMRMRYNRNIYVVNSNATFIIM